MSGWVGDGWRGERVDGWGMDGGVSEGMDGDGWRGE